MAAQRNGVTTARRGFAGPDHSALFGPASIRGARAASRGCPHTILDAGAAVRAGFVDRTGLWQDQRLGPGSDQRAWPAFVYRGAPPDCRPVARGKTQNRRLERRPYVAPGGVARV